MMLLYDASDGGLLSGEAYLVCDHCGRKLMDGEANNSDIALTMRRGNGIFFEWWSKGDYCYECSLALAKAVYESLPVPERCDRQFKDDDIAKSIENTLIKRTLGADDA